MRNHLRPAGGLTLLLALVAVAGCSSGSGGGTSDAAAGAPEGGGTPSAAASGTSYAPYVSATTASGNDAAGSPTTYNLAFVISDGSSCTPEWNGEYGIGNAAVKSRIDQLKTDGATVRVSFGGASGKELASACGNVTQLAAAYGKALDAAGATQADFDVEGDQLADSGSVAMRSAAIAVLQKERPALKVSFTLPVMPEGLDADSLALLKSANKFDVQVSTVNLMTMNYGESYGGDMGDYAVTSATAAHAQLRKVFGTSDAGAWKGMALTSMIGVNDVHGETFTLSDAAQVRKFAETKKIAWVSMWSSFRDQQCTGGDAASDDAATDCSGVQQSAGAFGKALAG
ncbi:chitinase [Streptomyces mangrovisoli]|uniref:Hydrolase n=1 Tax=Streptomyces mangrovisoli TaxID=1428628 RepID=A0A1J4NZZ3_9ACTN|nr:chitinase [Streptomyces mangrovisoli]OIJ66789.1 hydrolase [Streptomyces mangrovisoli]